MDRLIDWLMMDNHSMEVTTRTLDP